jgi:hypothetical protein
MEGYPALADDGLAAAVVIGRRSAHAVVVSVLTAAETLIAARRLAGARLNLTAVAGIVHHEDLWQLCRDELTPESTSAPAAGISAAAGSASSSGPRRGPGSCHEARRFPGG